MKHSTHTARSSRATQRWRPIVEALSASGLSVRAFAEQQGLSPATLYLWRRRLHPCTLDSVDPPRLVPIAITAAAPMCEIVLRSGRVLRFDPTLDPETLLRLMRAAETT